MFPRPTAAPIVAGRNPSRVDQRSVTMAPIPCPVLITIGDFPSSLDDYGQLRCRKYYERILIATQGYCRKMSNRRAFLASVAAGIAGGLAGCSILGGEREVISQYTYELNVEPSDSISEAILYAPTPIENGEAALSDLVEDARGQLPNTWSYEFVDTDRGPMLEIRTPELIPDEGPYYTSVSGEVDDEIETREALTTEPVLGPRSNIDQVECDFPHPDAWEDRLRCYSYESEMYGEYDGGIPTLISVGLWGENSWWNGGWNGNEYLDRVSGTVTGDGWASASAGFREGMGNY